jgi:hypothetical protein
MRALLASMAYDVALVSAPSLLLLMQPFADFDCALFSAGVFAAGVRRGDVLAAAALLPQPPHGYSPFLPRIVLPQVSRTECSFDCGAGGFDVCESSLGVWTHELFPGTAFDDVSAAQVRNSQSSPLLSRARPDLIGGFALKR